MLFSNNISGLNQIWQGVTAVDQNKTGLLLVKWTLINLAIIYPSVGDTQPGLHCQYFEL